jgi:hypothetical protein
MSHPRLEDYVDDLGDEDLYETGQYNGGEQHGSSFRLPRPPSALRQSATGQRPPSRPGTSAGGIGAGDRRPHSPPSAFSPCLVTYMKPVMSYVFVWYGIRLASGNEKSPSREQDSLGGRGHRRCDQATRRLDACQTFDQEARRRTQWYDVF